MLVMIGVVAEPAESEMVCEFFELFKTPWEWYRAGRHYEVLLCAGDRDPADSGGDLVVIYGSRPLPFDLEEGLETVSQEKPAAEVHFGKERIPIYGESITFSDDARISENDETGHSAVYTRLEGPRRVARIGYDLFQEVGRLLAVGQPAANAGVPTLELHIALLRSIIIRSGVPFVEIPPAPEGYRFIASLTHDIDHPSIRRHRFDHTVLGFLHRAVLVSLAKACRKQVPIRSLLRNWVAVVKLPFVYLGLANDFWYQFDRYLSLENGRPSTFFVIPHKGRPGRLKQGTAPDFRASKYCAADIAAKIQVLLSAGCEIGVHGIDAWLDSSSGRAELKSVLGITGRQRAGVRMHWLYFDEQSPLALDEAGADYDSTVGYNNTIGYRAGTTQVYKPRGASRLLELPLHIMDTAMFYPVHLNLSLQEAHERVGRITEYAVQLGGAITVNWHDRSISPERCWDNFYTELVRNLSSKGAWFATAADTVSWFRKRRSAVFEYDGEGSDIPRLKVMDREAADLPPLQLRVYNVRQTRPGSSAA